MQILDLYKGLFRTFSEKCSVSIDSILLTLRTTIKICKNSRKPDPPEGVGHSSADGTGERLLLVGGEVVLRHATHLQKFDVVKLFVSGPETKVRELKTLQYLDSQLAEAEAIASKRSAHF